MKRLLTLAIFAGLACDDAPTNPKGACIYKITYDKYYPEFGDTLPYTEAFCDRVAKSECEKDDEFHAGDSCYEHGFD